MNDLTNKGPLSGFRFIEIEGIGPAPFAGMMLADMGADVIVVERTDGKADATTDFGSTDILKRGKRSIAVDLKSEAGRELVLKLIESANGLIEGMRPGVMERLGLGPEVCLQRNPELVYGRVTGWGQDGPMALRAAHDINYIALSGALWYSGRPGEPPFAPPTLIGDVGGGALHLVVGLLAAALNAKKTHCGQVVDANVVDGSANMMNLVLSLIASGQGSFSRGQSLIDGPHWFDSYRCSDGQFITVGSLEIKFYKTLLVALGLEQDPVFQEQYNSVLWPGQKERLTEIFLSRTQAQWVEMFGESDACFAPVLDPRQAMEHSHNQARGFYFERDGILQAAPSPRFSVTQKSSIGNISPRGANTRAIMTELGLTDVEIKKHLEAGLCLQSND
jgi:alpha-methylacyl-CoA racemase|tara:strand:- start:2190 stop:3362 length:1173 start_codon:yes stop_codon:yes gene_type:complete